MHKDEWMYVGRMEGEVIPDPSSRDGMSLVYRPIVQVVRATLEEQTEPPVMLPARDDLLRYESAYEWGRESGGSRSLALALLAHAVSERVAVRLHELFSAELLSRFDAKESWTLSSEEVLRWAANAGLEKAA